MLNWYRSWPDHGDLAKYETANGLHLPPHVEDDLPKLLISGYNYREPRREGGGSEQGWPADTPGLCMLEWDVALDPIARRAFAAEALIHPRELLVASYTFHDTQCMWINDDSETPGAGPQEGGRPVTGYDTRTHSFGLGCVYIPQVILGEFLAQMDHLGFTDYTFGRWYYEHYGPARLTWRVHPQHLHEWEDA